MQNKISASIVVYKNDLEELSRAVSSFLNDCPEGMLYLIDNSPVDKLKGHFDHPRIVHQFNNKNIGFGAAHNIALRESLRLNYRYHLILNPDIYFDRGVIQKIEVFMDTHNDIGLTMPKIVYPDGRIQYLCKLLPSPYILFLRRFFPFNQSMVKQKNHVYEMHFTGYDKIMDVPFLSGCFMFLRNDTLRKVGLFDERIFLYTEDTDLTRRIHRQSRTVFFPEAMVYHRHERGSYKNWITLLHHMLSAVTYFNKWGWFKDPEREVINNQILVRLYS